MARSVFCGLSVVLALLAPSLALANPPAERPRGPIRPVTPADAAATENAEAVAPVSVTAPVAAPATGAAPAVAAAPASGAFAPTATALIDEAKANAAKPDDRAAADALTRAIKVSKLSTDERKQLEGAIAHLAEGRFVDAELGFAAAKEIAGPAQGPQLAAAGHEIARARRLASEKVALGALQAGKDDPRVHARVLRDALRLDPNNKVLGPAADQLFKRAREAAKKGNDDDLAKSVEAAAILENLSKEDMAAVEQATQVFIKGEHETAGRAYQPLIERIDGPPSKAGVVGTELARERRIAVLKKQVDDHKKAGNVVGQSKVVAQLMSLNPKDRSVETQAAQLRSAAVTARLQRSEKAEKEGVLGLAWLEAARALELDAKNAKAAASKTAIETKLREQTDLVIRVSRPRRAEKSNKESCKGFDDRLASRVMEEAAPKTDLGGFVLSPAWTEVVDKKDARAPNVTGELVLTIDRCESGASTGKTALTWSVNLLEAKGKVTSTGQASAELPQGLIPRDEQDGAGNNAKKALADRTAKAVIESMQQAKKDTEGWLLLVAESAIAEKNKNLTALAYAKMSARARGYDKARLDAVRGWLDKEVE